MKFTVNKERLLEQLRSNRTEHAEQYQQAMMVYREKAIEWFNECVDKVLKHGEVERALRLPMPEEHTADYDGAIEALEWHTGEEVELEEHQFDELVRNQWGWHRTFLQNTTSYLDS